MQINQDGQMIGSGEASTFHILKQLTLLKPRILQEFPKNGIYRQVPLKYLISNHDFNILSPAHQKGSVDILLVLNQNRIAVRVQGKGHGSGLKGIGKVKHDTVQALLIKKYCGLVDILLRECPNIFKERTTPPARQEIIDSFKTQNTLIPLSQDI